MKAQSLVSKKNPVDVDLLPRIDTIVSGFLLKVNSSIWVFIRFVVSPGMFDGFNVIRDRDISQYRKWEKTDWKDVKKVNQQKFFDKNLPVSKMNSMMSCIREAGKCGLIEIFSERNPHNFHVGKLRAITRKNATFQLVNKEGEWTRQKTFAISEIDFIQFQTSYLDRLEKRIERRNSGKAKGKS